MIFLCLNITLYIEINLQFVGYFAACFRHLASYIFFHQVYLLIFNPQSKLKLQI